MIGFIIFKMHEYDGNVISLLMEIESMTSQLHLFNIIVNNESGDYFVIGFFIQEDPIWQNAWKAYRRSK